VSAQDSQEEAVQKGQKVAQAGAAAASSSPPEQAQENAAQAMRAERDRVKLEISDEEIERIAAVLSPKLLDGFQERGAFDAPPEPVQAPQQAQTVAEPDTGEPPATEVPPAVPQKQTFAHRYMGLGG
jgi:hypothetical protein